MKMLLKIVLAVILILIVAAGGTCPPGLRSRNTNRRP